MRNKILNLKVSEEELADVKARAGASPVSEYLRSLIFTENVDTKATGQESLGVDGGGGPVERVAASVSPDAEVLDALASVPMFEVKRYAMKHGISEFRAKRELEGKS